MEGVWDLVKGVLDHVWTHAWSIIGPLLSFYIGQKWSLRTQEKNAEKKAQDEKKKAQDKKIDQINRASAFERDEALNRELQSLFDAFQKLYESRYVSLRQFRDKLSSVDETDEIKKELLRLEKNIFLALKKHLRVVKDRTDIDFCEDIRKNVYDRLHRPIVAEAVELNNRFTQQIETGDPSKVPPSLEGEQAHELTKFKVMIGQSLDEAYQKVDILLCNFTEKSDEKEKIEKLLVSYTQYKQSFERRYNE